MHASSLLQQVCQFKELPKIPLNVCAIISGSALAFDLETNFDSFKDLSSSSSGFSQPKSQQQSGPESAKQDINKLVCGTLSDTHRISTHSEDNLMSKIVLGSDLHQKKKNDNIHLFPSKSCGTSRMKHNSAEDSLIQRYEPQTPCPNRSEILFPQTANMEDEYPRKFPRCLHPDAQVQPDVVSKPMDITSNTLSEICQSVTESIDQAYSAQMKQCCPKPSVHPKPSAPIRNMCNIKPRGFVPQNSTLRRIPQGDGLGPLKPWPSFDYGMSGEEYLALFHQRNIRLNALKGNKGSHPNMAMEPNTESMVPPPPYIPMNWHQRANTSSFPGSSSGFINAQTHMMSRSVKQNNSFRDDWRAEYFHYSHKVAGQKSRAILETRKVKYSALHLLYSKLQCFNEN